MKPGNQPVKTIQVGFWRILAGSIIEPVQYG